MNTTTGQQKKSVYMVSKAFLPFFFAYFLYTYKDSSHQLCVYVCVAYICIYKMIAELCCPSGEKRYKFILKTSMYNI